MSVTRLSVQKGWEGTNVIRLDLPVPSSPQTQIRTAMKIRRISTHVVKGRTPGHCACNDELMEPWASSPEYNDIEG